MSHFLCLLFAVGFARFQQQYQLSLFQFCSPPPARCENSMRTILYPRVLTRTCTVAAPAYRPRVRLDLRRCFRR